MDYITPIRTILFLCLKLFIQVNPMSVFYYKLMLGLQPNHICTCFCSWQLPQMSMENIDLCKNSLTKRIYTKWNKQKEWWRNRSNLKDTSSPVDAQDATKKHTNSVRQASATPHVLMSLNSRNRRIAESQMKITEIYF